MKCPNCRCEVQYNYSQCPYCGFDLAGYIAEKTRSESLKTAPVSRRLSKRRNQMAGAGQYQDQYFQTYGNKRRDFRGDDLSFGIRMNFVIGTILLGAQLINLIITLAILLKM